MDKPSSAEKVLLENLPPEYALLAASMNQARIAAICGLLHDMVNSIMGIYSLSESLVRSIDPEHPLKANIDLIYKSAIRSQKKLHSISEVNRSKRDEPTLVDLTKLTHRQKEVLEVVLPPGASLIIDSTGPELPVRIDENTFRMVLLHFALNAVGSLTTQCRIKLFLRRVAGGSKDRRAIFPQPYGLLVDAAELSFSDMEGGIPPAILPRVFEPFFTTREKLGGMGLGLYFAKNFAQKHGGQLGILSEDGVGTTILLLLPLAKLESA